MILTVLKREENTKSPTLRDHLKWQSMHRDKRTVALNSVAKRVSLTAVTRGISESLSLRQYQHASIHQSTTPITIKPPSLPVFVFLINYLTCHSMFFK